MLLQQLNQNDPERVFVNGQNVSTATLAAHTLVCWEGVIVAAASKGIGFQDPITSNLNLFAGVLPAAVAAGAYGLVQVYGEKDSIAANVATNVSISCAGEILGPVAGQVSAQSNGQSFVFGPIVVLDNAASGSTYVRGFIRAM